MKKLFCIVLAIFFAALLLSYKNEVKGQQLEKSISNKLIRFHILANTDSLEDQNLKLKVKDEVLKFISPKLKKCKTIEESRKVLKDNNQQIINTAKKIIKQNGYNYDVKAFLVHDNFPIKSYGNITLPAGNYEAYKIIIGKGNGHNWWCVMFPPLCFVDITRGEPAYEENKKNMEKVLSSDELKYVDGENTKDIKFKFKIVDIFKNIFK